MTTNTEFYRVLVSNMAKVINMNKQAEDSGDHRLGEHLLVKIVHPQ